MINMETTESKKNYTTMSLYDYFKYRKENPYSPTIKLVGVITDRQRLFDLSRADLNEHWFMTSDIFQDIYPDRGYSPENLCDTAITIFSNGDDLAIDIPKDVSKNQFDCLTEILKQIKMFEYDFDTMIHMPSTPEEYLFEAKRKMTGLDLYRSSDDEVILGESIEKTKEPVPTNF